MFRFEYFSSDIMAEYIPGRGKSKYLKIGDFLYSKTKSYNDQRLWRCIKHCENGCKATAVTCQSTDELLRQPYKAHSHEANPKLIYHKRKFAELKDKVKQKQHQPIKRVFNEAFEDEDATDTTSCSYTGMKSTLYRERQKLVPLLPKEIQDIKLEGECSM